MLLDVRGVMRRNNGGPELNIELYFDRSNLFRIFILGVWEEWC